MAQLHVQKKRNQLWWLWVIIILIAIAVTYYLLVQNNTLPDTFGLKNVTASISHSGKDYFIV